MPNQVIKFKCFLDGKRAKRRVVKVSQVPVASFKPKERRRVKRRMDAFGDIICPITFGKETHYVRVLYGHGNLFVYLDTELAPGCEPAALAGLCVFTGALVEVFTPISSVLIAARLLQPDGLILLCRAETAASCFYNNGEAS